ncbi:hypothetical protein RchiOBHm_Chr2g0165761 [Rosa chinensis]|uniref:Uncharacterized protein n=1 Tax=Rosa chinensis TaxID=74649 RepID=A0A2P6S3W1_ROSCH|nr:hypothetical protein RchiOBHm_Chr2g0165761 [Rosa chinensis]
MSEVRDLTAKSIICLENKVEMALESHITELAQTRHWCSPHTQHFELTLRCNYMARIIRSKEIGRQVRCVITNLYIPSIIFPHISCMLSLLSTMYFFT